MAEIPLPYPHSVAQAQPRAGEVDFLWRTYSWMSMGLGLTGAVAWFVANTPSLLQTVTGNPVVFYGAMIAEFVLVMVFATRAGSMSFATAASVFIAYAALNGVTMAMIFLVYTAASVARVFFVSAAAFGGLALYGATTKRDLTALGQFLFIGLIGVVIGSLVNLFLQNSALYWLTTYAGVLVFAGLTAYDNQKLRRLYALQGDTGNLALQGALTLYLDFVNLFLMLLRVFGRRRE
jgi:FtsH-binding integral membrane protein